MLEQLSSVTKEEAQVAEMTKICRRLVKCLFVCEHVCVCVRERDECLISKLWLQALVFLLVLAINLVNYLFVEDIVSLLIL